MSSCHLSFSLFLLFAGSLTAQTAPFTPPLEGEPWTIREVIRGEATWSYRLQGIVDVDKDGVVDFMAWEGPAEPENAGAFHHGGDLNTLHRVDGLYLDPARRIASGMMIKTPTGMRLASTGFFGDQGSQIRFLEGFSPHKIAKIDVPPPSAGGPFYSAFANPTPAGDINQDGFDDFYLGVGASFGWFSVAMIDGATMSIKWINDYNSFSGNSQLNNFWPDPTQDIDGDGVADIFLYSTSNSEQHIRCISGETGLEIWSNVNSIGPTGAITRAPSVIDDVNGDGIRDFFTVKEEGTPFFNPGPGFLRVYSGKDGSVIWDIPAANYDIGVFDTPPWSKIGIGSKSVHTGDFDGDGVGDIALLVTELIPPQSNPTFEYWMWIVSGRTGDPLVREPFSTALQSPWDTGTFPRNALAINPVGDIDNDGWTEFSQSGYLNSTQFNDFIIYGRTTLRHPKQAQEGDLIQLDLHIPTGANKPFQILFSTGFDDMQTGFFVRDLWNTHLVDNSILQASSRASSLRGSLDAQGKGGVQVRIPFGLGLTGQTLYGVAIIHDATRPEGILTKSSIAVIEVLP